MHDSAQRIPAGFHTVTPHLTVRGGAKMIEFYKQAFGAKEIRRSVVAPDGKSLCTPICRWRLAGFLNDEFPEMGGAPLGLNGTPVRITCTSRMSIPVPAGLGAGQSHDAARPTNSGGIAMAWSKTRPAIVGPWHPMSGT